MPVTQREVGNRNVLAYEASLDLSRLENLTDDLNEMGLQLETFFRLSNDLLCITDSTHFRLLNPRWTELLGWSLEELYSHPHEFFLHDDDRERTRRAIDGLAAEPMGRFVNRLYAKDGSYHILEWTASKLTGGLIYAAARDITEVCQECPSRHAGCSVLGFTDDSDA